MQDGSVELVEVGQAIMTAGAQKVRRVGRIAVFVTSRDPDAAGQIFCLTAAHALDPRPNAKVFNKKDQKIGRVEPHRFARALDLWRTDPDYSCLKDVCVIRIDKTVRVRNSSGQTPVTSVKSATRHFLSGDGEVFIKGQPFGRISKVKANTELLYPGGVKVRTSGFWVEREVAATDVLPGSSGRPVFTPGSELLGMMLATIDNGVFCLDLSEVMARLNCELLEYDRAGSVERELA